MIDAGKNKTLFREVMGHYPTGVCIITARDPQGAPTGMTVGSFGSVSLEPPLVAFFPDKSSSSWAKMAQADRFCVNILAEDQERLCRHFATKAIADKFKDVAHRHTDSALPILEGVVAWIDCIRHAIYDAGDHQIVLGEVQALAIERGMPPLLFLGGGYHRCHPVTSGGAA